MVMLGMVMLEGRLREVAAVAGVQGVKDTLGVGDGVGRERGVRNGDAKGSAA